MDSKIIGYTFDNLFDYYLMQNKPQRQVYLYVHHKKDIQSIYKKIDSITNRYIWLISAHLSPGEKFINHFYKHHKLIIFKKFIKSKIWLFEKRHWVFPI